MHEADLQIAYTRRHCSQCGLPAASGCVHRGWHYQTCCTESQGLHPLFLCGVEYAIILQLYCNPFVCCPRPHAVDGVRIIDATGKLVMPGTLTAHFHFLRQ